MHTPSFYRFLNHIDSPKRLLTFTLDEVTVFIVSLLLLILVNQKIPLVLLSFSWLTLLRRLKKGAGPKSLLVLAYWYLPYSVMQLFLPQLPASHHRLWLAVRRA